MKKYRWIFIGIGALSLIAVGAYFWATSLLGSLYDYRSLLHDAPPAPAESFDWSKEDPITRRVVFILVDGLRNDTSHNKEVMPYLNELRTQGAWATSHSRSPSYSAPGYSVLGTGAWPFLSDGPALNLEYENIPMWTQDNLFSATHRAGLKTAISAYNWFEKLIPQEDVDASFYTAKEDDSADRDVVDAAIPWLNANEYQFIFIHLDQLDYAGHYEGGPQGPHWDAAAGRVDAYISEIVSHLDLELDTVLITSDHGHIDIGGHGGFEDVVLTEPLVLAGAGVRSGQHPDAEMVDISPTLAALLGANIPATSQGHILFDMLSFSPEQEVEVKAALEAQQRQLHASFTEVIGGDPLPIREDMEFVTGTQFAIEAMLLQQLNNERQTRFTWPIIFAIFPAYALFRTWNDKKIRWLLAGAVAYLLLYNIRYAIIDRQTYSLSSITDVDALVIYNAITVSIVFGLVWLALMFKLGIFKKGVIVTAETTMLLAGMILYFLSLPVLWQASVNGILVDWALPEFPILFRAFLSLVQGIMVGAIGIVLAGIGALVAKFTSNQSL